MYCLFCSMRDLMRGIRSLHPFWQLWVLVLLLFNFMFPLFFFDRIEAVYTFMAGMLGAGIGMFMVSVQGFTRLLGVMHITWIPLLYFLWSRLDGLDAHSPFGLWVVFLMVFNAASLVIDIADVARYILGDRSPLAMPEKQGD